MTARNAAFAAALVPLAAHGSSGPIGELLFLAFALLCAMPAVLAAIAGVFVRRLGYWRSLVALAVVIGVGFTVLAYVERFDRIFGPALFAFCVAALVHGLVYGSLWVARKLLRNTNPTTVRNS